jgi:hypothetical protein
MLKISIQKLGQKLHENNSRKFCVKLVLSIIIIAANKQTAELEVEGWGRRVSADGI